MDDPHQEDQRMLDILQAELADLDDLFTTRELRALGGIFARTLRLRIRRTIFEVSQQLDRPEGTIGGIEAGNSWAQRGYLAWLALQVHDLPRTPEQQQFLRRHLLDRVNELMHLIEELRDQLAGRGESVVPLRRIDWTPFADEEEPGWANIRTVADKYQRSLGWPGPQFPPRPRSICIGRDAEMDQLATWLGGPRFRSIVLTGPTGIGKTRLIQEFVYVKKQMLHQRFRDGASYIDLALIRNQLTALPPRDQELLTLSAIARQLGISEMQGHGLLEILSAYLQDKQMLLVIDHVAYPQPLIPLLQRLQAAEDLRIILVARSWRAGTLRQTSLPLGSLDAADAVELFKQRASDPIALPNGEETQQMTEDICRWLQQHPLLIKLVAAAHKIYDLPEIHAQIHALLPTTTDGQAQAAPLPEVVRLAVSHFEARHQEWLAYLSIFPASFTLDAAQAVCQGDTARTEIRTLVADLAEQQLAHGSITERGRRYMLQDAFRQHLIRYAPPDFAIARQRFVRYFLAEAERAAHYLTLPVQRAGFTHGVVRFQQEYPNIRAALNIALDIADTTTALSPGAGCRDDTTAIQFGAALWRFWWSTGSQTEGQIWLDKLLARGWPYPRAAWAQVLAGAAAMKHALGDLTQAYTLGQQALEAAQAAADPAAQATAHIIFGAILIDYADPNTRLRKIKAGIVKLAKGVKLAQLVNDAWLEALGTYNLGRGWSEKARLFDVAYGPDRQPDLEHARQNLEQSLAVSTTLNDPWLIATIACWLGRVAAAQGHFDEARRHWDTSRHYFESIPHTLGVALVLYGLADVAYQEGAYLQANDLTHQRLQIETAVGNEQGIASCHAWLGRIKAAQGDHQGGYNLLQESFVRYQAITDSAGEREVWAWLCEVLYVMAASAYQQRDYDRANDRTHERLTIETALGNQQAIASCRAWQGRIKVAQGDHQGGCDLLQQSLALYQAIGDVAGVEEVRNWIQELNCENGDAADE